jgi:hypothetical protein
VAVGSDVAVGVGVALDVGKGVTVNVTAGAAVAVDVGVEDGDPEQDTALRSSNIAPSRYTKAHGRRKRCSSISGDPFIEVLYPPRGVLTKTSAGLTISREGPAKPPVSR